MSFLEQAKDAIETGETDEQWVYGRYEKLLVEIKLGSGVRLEVTYHTKDDTDLDNIEEAVLYENGSSQVLEQEDIQIMSDLDII